MKDQRENKSMEEERKEETVSRAWKNRKRSSEYIW